MKAAETTLPPARDLLVEWPEALYETLKDAGVRHMSYVPDAGHSTLIRLFCDDTEVTSNVLTTEEEGIAIASGAWLGGARSVVLMQSSGVAIASICCLCRYRRGSRC
jgi:sulfopyruvate decarboxylase TPP-binding subunit